MYTYTKIAPILIKGLVYYYGKVKIPAIVEHVIYVIVLVCVCARDSPPRWIGKQLSRLRGGIVIAWISRVEANFY